jgi:hypothetical protein
MVIGLDFPARPTLAKQQIPGTEGVVVIPEIPAITSMIPASLESRAIEQLAPTLSRTVHQEKIIAAKPNDRSLLQVFRTGGLRNPVKFEHSSWRRAGDAQARFP